MVEFPLVDWRSAKGLRRQLRSLSQMPPFADINFASSSRHLTLAGMWEISTGGASVHARLNVAPAADLGQIALPGLAGERLLAGIGADRLPPPAAGLLQFFTDSAAPWPASG
jgi:hypothetical protein